MGITRRVLLQGAACLVATRALADGYPNRPIRLITPYPAGGTTDIVARALATPLSQALGQTIIVDNRVGSGGLIGHDAGAKAAPDGYTLLLGNSTMLAVSVSLYPSMPYDPIKDFAPISLLAKGGLVLMVNPKVPVKTVAELIAYAKQNPNKLNAGLSSLGTIHHLLNDALKKIIGADWLNVPYNGSTPMLVDLMGGQVELAFDNIPSAVGYVKAGRLRAIAVSGETRSALLPDVPTLREAGIPLSGVSWHGLLAPAGTPKNIIDLLYREAAKIIKTPNIQADFERLGLDPVGGTPAEFAQFIKDENLFWAKIAKESGAKLE